MTEIRKVNFEQNGPKHSVKSGAKVIELNEEKISSNEETEKIKQKLGDLCEKLKKLDTSERTIELIQELKQILGDNELFKNEQVIESIKIGLTDCLSHWIPNAKKIIQIIQSNSTDFDQEVFFLKVILPATRYRLTYCLRNGNTVAGNELIKYLKKNIKDLKKEDIFTDEIKQILKDNLSYFLKKNRTKDAIKLIQFIIENNDNLNNTNQDLFREISFSTLQNNLIEFFNKGQIYEAEKLIQFIKKNLSRNFNIQDLFSEEVCNLASDKLLSFFTENHYASVKKIIKLFQKNSISQDFIKEIILPHATKKIIFFIRGGWNKEAKSLITFLNEELGITNQDLFLNNINFLQIARDGLLFCLNNGQIERARNLIQFLHTHVENFNIDELFFDREKILLASQNGVSIYLGMGDINRVTEFVNFLSTFYKDFNKNDLFSDIKVISATRNKLSFLLSSHDFNKATEFIQFLSQHFQNFNEIVIQATRIGFANRLKTSKLFTKDTYKELVNFLNKNGINFNEEELFKDEILQASYIKLSNLLREGNDYRAKELIQFLREKYSNLSVKELIPYETILKEVRYFLASYNWNDLNSVEELIKFLNEHYPNFNVNDLFHDGDKIFKGIRNKLYTNIYFGDYNFVEQTISFLSNLYNDFDEKYIFCDNVIEIINFNLRDAFGLEVQDKDYDYDNDYCDAYYNRIDHEGDLFLFLTNHYNSLYKNILLSDKKVIKLSYNKMEMKFEIGDIDTVRNIHKFLEKYYNPDFRDFFSNEKIFQSSLNALSKYLIKNDHNNANYLKRILNTYYEDAIKINQEHLDLVSKKNYFDLYSIQKAIEDGIKIFIKEKKGKKINCKELFPYLVQYGEVWHDSQIREPFERGIELFGYDLMFEYIDNSKCSLHDLMMGFDTICDFCEKYCKTQGDKEKFFYNILKQVKNDNSRYNEGFSHDHLRAIIDNLINLDLNQLFNEAMELKKSLSEVSELIDYFINDTNNSEFDVSKIIASWKDLKKFIKLKEIVDDKEFHLKLEDIRINNPPLYKYVIPLLFHKDSNVNKEKVWLFINNPEKFFSIWGDQGVGPHYGDYNLSAVELRQAIVERKLDEIQEIRPMEVEYEVRKRSTLDYLIDALGKRSENIRGKASNPNTIYDVVGYTLEGLSAEQRSKQRKPTYNKLKQVFDGTYVLSKEEEEQILKILKSDRNMKTIIDSETEVYRAQIHRKSDPFATVVGNDTACCMPFGSEKGMVYFFTPNNAIFSIQKRQANGKFRTIAQSVVTLDIDTGTTDLHLPDDIAKISNEAFNKMYLTCDNVEVAPNFQNSEHIEKIEEIYREFFGSYLKKYGESIGVDKEEVIIGKGYGDALKGLQTKPNTFYTTSKLSYSDNDREYSYVLNVNKELPPNLQIIETKRVESKPHENKKIGQYIIEEIYPSDILRIAKVENDIYGGLKQGIVEMQKMIEAYLIKNAIARRQSLMFKMMESEGITSYMVAAENNYGDVREVEISDFASKRERSFFNTFMLREFFNRYIEQYGDEDTLPVITAEFREKTSYNIVKDEDKLNKMLKRYGVRAKVVETGTDERGVETFHKCIIFLIRLNEDDTKFDELKDIYEKAHY